MGICQGGGIFPALQDQVHYKSMYIHDRVDATISRLETGIHLNSYHQLYLVSNTGMENHSPMTASFRESISAYALATPGIRANLSLHAFNAG